VTATEIRRLFLGPFLPGRLVWPALVPVVPDVPRLRFQAVHPGCPAAAATYALHLQPTEPGWLDMALAVPLMDSSRAAAELGWTPRHGSLETLWELLGGLAEAADHSTPPLARSTSGPPARLRELVTGLGRRP
jgi:UDP-glucose 4-epimerase